MLFRSVEKSVISGNKTEVFISNIERLFQSGEYVQILDSNNQFVLDGQGNPVAAKVVGQISQVNITPAYRGLLYSPGDPVIIHGGLENESGKGAIAEVGSTTAGAITSIGVSSGGYGYPVNPQTIINIQYNNTGAKGAAANVVTFDPDIKKQALVTMVANTKIGVANNVRVDATNYSFLSQHPTANNRWKLMDALSFTSFMTYPISSVLVTNGGGGITTLPTVTAESLYGTDVPGNQAYLESLGILAPIQIVNPGVGYRANDKIIISGGSGYGAFANVTTVDSSGEITGVSYVYDANTTIHKYPLGEIGRAHV